MKESRLHAVLTAIIDVVWAGLLCLLCSLPVFTVGASCTALYYVAVKCIRRERGEPTPNFFRCFRENFRQATALWLICLAYLLVGIADVFAFGRMGIAPGHPLYYISRFFFLPAALLLPWLFAVLSRFQNTVGGTLKFTVFLLLRNPGRSLLLALELALLILIAWLLPQILPLLPGAVCLLMSFTIEPVFKRYTADADAPDAWFNE